MKEYSVILDNPAEEDMLKLRRYISKTLREPVIAKRIYSSIKAEILSLDHNPLRFPVVRDELYASLGIRCMPVENYLTFYSVDQTAKEVHILRVLYNRREWQTLI